VKEEEKEEEEEEVIARFMEKKRQENGDQLKQVNLIIYSTTAVSYTYC
jgi:hypothetical protein